MRTTSLMMGLLAVVAVASSGCGAGADPQAPETSSEPGANANDPAPGGSVAFEGHYDANAGTLDIAYRAPSGLATQAIPTVTLAYGTGTNQFYFHTDSVAWDGVTHKLTGQVRAVNGYKRTIDFVTSVIDSVSDVSVTYATPMASYGSVTASTTSGALTWTFTSPSNSSFSFLGHASGAPATGAIVVTEATYGPRCGVATNGPSGAHLTSAKAVCDGKAASCLYPASGTILSALGDPAGGCLKDYVIKWTCDGAAASTSPKTLCPGGSCEAGFSNIQITCP